MELNNIQSTGRWDKISGLLNDNFAKLKLAIETGDPTGPLFNAVSLVGDVTGNGEIKGTTMEISAKIADSWGLKKGYLVATAADKNNWNTAFGWGNHASAGYLKTHQSLAGYATQSWVNSQGFLKTHQSLAAYATQVWANANFMPKRDIDLGNEHMTGDFSMLDSYNTFAHGGVYNLIFKGNPVYQMFVGGDTWGHNVRQILIGNLSVTDGKINSTHSDSRMTIVFREYNISGGGTTKVWSEWKNYLDDYATQAWVESKNYLTAHQSLAGYATQSWVNSQGFLKSVSWASVSGKPAWIGSAKPTYTYSEVGAAAAGHNHSGVYEPVFTKNTAFNKNFGTAAGTVAQGNDNRIVNGQTAFGWGNHASAGYLKTHQSLAGYATQTWVNSQGFLKSVAWAGITGKPTTIAGYGITDAKIANGVITIGANSITPLTSHQSLAAYATQAWVTGKGYLVATATDKTNWNNAFKWGNHANAGYSTLDYVNPYLTVRFDGIVDSATLESASITVEAPIYYIKSLKRFAALYQGKYYGNWVGSEIYRPFVDAPYTTKIYMYDDHTYYFNGTDFVEYATQTWVNSQGFLKTHQSLSGYATQAWVNSQGFLKSVAWSIISGKPTTLAGYGITDAKIASGVITLGANTITPLTAASSLAWAKLTGKPTTLAGYGITDAKIANGVITLGSNTITPLTSHQSLAGYATQTWVNAQGFLKSVAWSAVTGKPTTLAGYGITDVKIASGVITIGSDTITPITSLTGYATTSWANSTFPTKAGSGASGTWGISITGNAKTATTATTATTANKLANMLTFAAGTFAAKTYNGAAATTVNVPTHTSHLTNNSGFITNSALTGYATQAWTTAGFLAKKIIALRDTTSKANDWSVLDSYNKMENCGYYLINAYPDTNVAATNPVFMYGDDMGHGMYQVVMGNFGTTNGVITGHYDSKLTILYREYHLGSGGSSTVPPRSWGKWKDYLDGYATQAWVEGKKYLTAHQSLAGYATQSWVTASFPTKTGTGASGLWGISISGNAATATKLGTATVGSATKPIYLNGGTATACGASLAVSVTGNAATATKLATARTITLSGGVTGSFSFDGSANVSFNTNANYVRGMYNSGGIEKPTYSRFSSGKLSLQMLRLGKENLKFSSVDGWADVLYMSSYTGNDVKMSHALVLPKSGLSTRDMYILSQNWDATDWDATPARVATDLNFADIAKKIGTLDIKLKVNDTFDPTAQAVNSSNAGTFCVYDSYNVSGTPTTYGDVIEINSSRASHWKPQLWFDSGANGSLRHRNRDYNTTAWGAWHTLVDSNNYTTIVKKIGTANVGSSALPIYLNAGTPTQCASTLGVSITGNAASATKLATARTLWGQSFNGTANISGDMTGVGRLQAQSRFNEYLATYNGTINAKGTICITLPNGFTNAMNIYEIYLYEYINGVAASVITVAGYNYESKNWINIGYHTKGSYNKKVRLGYNGSKCVIMLGETTTVWQYPQVFLKSVYNGFNNITGWNGVYSISLITSETEYTSIITPPKEDEYFGDVYASSFNGSLKGNADTATTATTANKVAGTLTFAAGAFAGKTFNGSAAVTVNVPTHTSHLTNNSGFLTSASSLAWAKLTGKPTTLAGYGVTDGVNAVSVTGSGNAVTSASVSGHTLTLTKGATFLTSHQSLAAYATQAWVNAKGYLVATATDKANWNNAYSWGDHAYAGYATADYVNPYLTVRFDGFVESATMEMQSLIVKAPIYYVKSLKRFAALYQGKYYNNWVDANLYRPNLDAPYTTKIYMYGDHTYYFNGTDFVEYATQSWVNSQGFLKTHQSLAAYATTTWANNTFPTKAGSGASGTWGISITGNAKTATTATTATTANKVAGTLTFAAGAFAAKTYNGAAAVTVNIPTHTSHLTNNSGFLTAHQSLAAYATTSYVSSNYLKLTGGIASGQINVKASTGKLASLQEAAVTLSTLSDTAENARNKGMTTWSHVDGYCNFASNLRKYRFQMGPVYSDSGFISTEAFQSGDAHYVNIGGTMPAILGTTADNATMYISAGASTIIVNPDKPTYGGTVRAVPATWLWRDGTASGYANFVLGSVVVNDQLGVLSGATFQSTISVTGAATFNSQSKFIGGKTCTTATNDTGYIVIGNNTGNHLSLDYGRIQSYSNAGYSSMYINYYGGNIYIGNSAYATFINSKITRATAAVDGASLQVGSAKFVYTSSGTKISLTNSAGVLLDFIAKNTSASSSDARLKTSRNYNVDYCERLMSLGRVFDYKYNELAKRINAPGYDELTHTGLLYQDVAGVMPHITNTFHKDYGAIDYRSPDLISLIIGATQMNIIGMRGLVEKTDNIEDEVLKLKQENKRLQQRVEELENRVN